ncbi:hypothetical protein [Nocardia sp. NPDC050435]|uniref:hypothetical protein n=1 Tax=Nocardia sp. NPDC050435 TaxID=3155040 RepID=UPI003403F000
MSKSGAVVKEWVPEPRLWNLDHLTGSGTKLALLPDRLDLETEMAYYREEVAGTLKLIQRQLPDADFSLPSTQRRYLSEYGIDGVTTFIGLAILTPLIYDVAKACVSAAAVRVRARLGMAPTENVAQQPITLRVAFLNSGSSEVRGIEITGTVEEVERVLLGLVDTSGAGELGRESDVE